MSYVNVIIIVCGIEQTVIVNVPAAAGDGDGAVVIRAARAVLVAEDGEL